MGEPSPVLPDYEGAGIAQLLPALMAQPGSRPGWLPSPLAKARQIVLVVVDGLGWHQLEQRWELAPAMRSMTALPITSVAPTTTATALTSIVTGSPPAAHGIVGYKIRITGPTGDEVLNVLRWRTPSGDAREFAPPESFQTKPAFGGRAVPVVSRTEFDGSGFSLAHQDAAPLVSWTVASSIAVDVQRLLEAGEDLVYVYYDGIDRVAHAKGFGAHYDAELAAVDRLLGDLASVLPAGAALAVTADHGQVEVGERAQPLDLRVLADVALISGEGRFRWLHASPGRTGEVRRAAEERYGHEAWVVSFEQAEAELWFGGSLDAVARARVGDVAIVAHQPVAYLDPEDQAGGHRGPPMVCRHGSLTAEEMWVPLLACG
ncbi:MAG: alkaline phosphatase family protein [Acidimicrobiales bacterium]